MDETRFEDLEFIVGQCASCGREVLTYTDYDAAGHEERHCVHCDQVVQWQLRSTKGETLSGSGYGVFEDAGCGRPGCGGGQCSRRGGDA